MALRSSLCGLLLMIAAYLSRSSGWSSGPRFLTAALKMRSSSDTLRTTGFCSTGGGGGGGGAAAAARFMRSKYDKLFGSSGGRSSASTLGLGAEDVIGAAFFRGFGAAFLTLQMQGAWSQKRQASTLFLAIGTRPEEGRAWCDLPLVP